MPPSRNARPPAADDAERFRLAVLALACGGLLLLALLTRPWILAGGGLALPLLLPFALLAVRTARQAARGQTESATLWLLVPPLLLALAGLLGLAPGRMPERLLADLVAEFLLFGALAAGMRLAACFGIDPAREPGSAFLYGGGLGLAALGAVVFLLGRVGALHAASAWGLAILLPLLGAAPLAKALEALPAAWGREARRWPPLAWGGGALLLLLLALLLPYSFFPPLDYDILEYHLQLPREYYETGRIGPTPHNAFGGLPRASEMLSLLSFHLAGLGQGVWTSRILHLAFLPLLLGAAFDIVRRLATLRDDGAEEIAAEGEAASHAGRAGGVVAALLALGTVQTVVLGSMQRLYVEPAMAAAAFLALLAALRAWSAPSSFLRAAALAGALAGAAAAYKLPALLFVGAPVALLVAFGPTAGGVSLRRRLGGGLLAAGVCWLVLFPWLAANVSDYGNPFYPLWNDLFDVPGWSAAQAERFRRAHAPATLAPASLLAQARRVFVSGERLGPLAWSLLPAALLLPRGRSRRAAAALLAWTGGGLLLWWGLTHRLERFAYPVYLPLVLLSGLGLAAWRMRAARAGARGARWAGAGACLASALLALAFLVGQAAGPLLPARGETAVWEVLVGRKPAEDLLAQAYGPEPLRRVMAAGKTRGGRALLVGAADPFWLPAPTAYAVVFSRHPLFDLLREGADAETVRRRLAGHGIRFLYFHWGELARLHATYYRAYDLTPAQQRVLLDLLLHETAPAGPRPLTPPWRFAAAAERSPYLRRLAEDYATLFPGGTASAGVGRAPHELYRLRDLPPAAEPEPR